MKIAMMTRWNVPSGLAAHAEPVGHAWLEMGHDLTVFAPKGIDIPLNYQKDEHFVHRCFILDIWGARDRSDYFFDPDPFLEEDYEIFLVENAGIMPMKELLEIFTRIKKKAKTVLVVHEVGLPDNPTWYKFDWDAIVCFDARYKEFMAKAFPEDRIVIIPFPCHPAVHGDREHSRLHLNLPPDKKIIFSCGFNLFHEYQELFPIVEKLNKDYPVLLLLVTHHDIVGKIPGVEYISIRDEMPGIEQLYSYLHASDVYLYYVEQTAEKIKGVGVSSSVATCLGAGLPVLVPGYCNFFDMSGNEVIKFDNLWELEQRLRDAFQETPAIKESLAAAEVYVNTNSGSKIAAKFMEMFDQILGKSLTKTTAFSGL